MWTVNRIDKNMRLLWGYLIDPLMCNIFWPSRGKSTSGGEVGRWRGRPQKKEVKNKPTAEIWMEVNTLNVKEGHFDLPRRCHPGWTWPPGSSGLSAGRWQNMFSLQKQHKHTLSQRYKRPRLKYCLKLKSSRVSRPLAVFFDHQFDHNIYSLILLLHKDYYWIGSYKRY